MNKYAEYDRIKLTNLNGDKRLPVVQDGKVIGSFPAGFNPRFASSKSFLYDIRPGDFTLESGKWICANNLGGSDVDCVTGFIRDPDFGK